jgi:glycerol-3-phosphate dehydrogenase (NAD(P)+)
MSHSIAVLGSGSWGTALAVHLARTGHDVRLWARDRTLAATMASQRHNDTYLPGIQLPPALTTRSMARRSW